MLKQRVKKTMHDCFRMGGDMCACVLCAHVEMYTYLYKILYTLYYVDTIQIKLKIIGYLPKAPDLPLSEEFL